MSHLEYHVSMKALRYISVVRSGGQTGADRGALDAARVMGVPVCGWCPEGGWAEDALEPPGLLAWYPELIEAPSPDPIVRTEWNVRDSDATLIVCPGEMSNCSGTAATLEFAKRYGKPYFVSNGSDFEEVRAWAESLVCANGAPKLQEGRPTSADGLNLNVAGPRESGSPGVYELTKDLIVRLLHIEDD